MRTGASLALIAITVALSDIALAQQVRLDGYLIATADCAANKRKDSDNPGNVRLEVWHAYEMMARNTTPGTHYQIKVPGAPESEARWVPMSCGAFAPKDSLVIVGGEVPEPGEPDKPTPTSTSLPPDSIEYVLAASWQPAFCQTSTGRSKTECRTQTADRYDSTHFSLHGLWPDDLDNTRIFPCYCDRGAPRTCSTTLARDSSIDLSAAVMDQLRIAMPGTMSGLELHEWPKHGSCYEDDKTGTDAGADPDEYFTEAMALIAALNASAVQALFASHIGGTLSRDEIEAALDEAFGAGAAERVTIKCNGSGDNAVIAELWINLKGDIGASPDFPALIQAAPTTATSTDNESCQGGRVQEVTSN